MKKLYILSVLLFLNINTASAEVKWQTINNGDAVSCLESDANGNFQDAGLDQCIQNLEVRHYFKHNSQKVEGCHLVTSRGTHIKDAPLDECISKNKTYYKNQSNGNGTYSCSLHAEFNNLFIKEVDFKENFESCVKDLDFKYYWVGPKKETCGAYNKKQLITELKSTQKCEDFKQHYVTDQAGKIEIIDTFDGIERMTATEVFEKLAADKKALTANLSQSEQEIIDINSDRPGSYRTLFKTGQTDAVRSEMRSSCFDYVKKAFKEGKSFYSKTLADKAYPLIETETRTGKKDTSFYHWTNGNGLLNVLETSTKNRDAAHKKALANKTYSKIFTFLRKRTSYENLWLHQFYLAEDPDSSREYGEELVRFDLKKTCKTINTTGTKIFIEALKEINRKIPGLQESCGVDSIGDFGWGTGGVQVNGRDGDYAPRKDVFFIIAEESGVEMLDYTDGLYFQMVSPTCIEKTSFVRSK